MFGSANVIQFVPFHSIIALAIIIGSSPVVPFHASGPSYASLYGVSPYVCPTLSLSLILSRTRYLVPSGIADKLPHFSTGLNL